MTTIGDTVFQKLEQSGMTARTVSITRLPAVQEAVAGFVRQGMISETLHRDWHFYLDANKDLPAAKTIFIVAIPQPVMRAWFEWHDISYPANFPPGIFVKADESRAAEVLGSALAAAGFRLVKAHLALKTLAVRSGLARYGRNNITYVPGIGSFHRLIAFYSDCPCEIDGWQEVQAMDACEKCPMCRENCPAGSIQSDRFLIRAENCQIFSDAERDASWWLGLDRRNTLVGCMLCQNVCPSNRMYLNKITDGPIFNIQETELILNGTPSTHLPSGTKQKLDRLAEDGIYPVLVQNLNTLIKSQDLKRYAP